MTNNYDDNHLTASFFFIFQLLHLYFLAVEWNYIFDNMVKEGIYIFDDEKEFLKALKELQKLYLNDEE